MSLGDAWATPVLHQLAAGAGDGADPHTGSSAVSTVSSSDDSANSEVLDRLLMLEPLDEAPGNRRRSRRRRRQWIPSAERAPAVDDAGERAVLDNMLRREHFVEQFLGDAGSPSHASDIRLATSNVAGGARRRMNDDIVPWAIANKLDFVVLSDAGYRENGARTVWAASASGGLAPAHTIVHTERAAIMMQYDRWHTRWHRDATKTSPSQRSLAITLRLGGRKAMVVIATYCPDTPADNVAATRAEHDWIAVQTDAAHAAGHLCVTAGDFNNYTDEALDRQGPERPPRSRQASIEFGHWTTAVRSVSTFRHLHPATARYTYQNGGTKSALDDILISAPHAHQVRESGIWLFSLNHGDHVGTPFAVITSGIGHARRLQGAQDVKVLRVKGRTPAELEQFAVVMTEGVAQGTVQLGTDLPNERDEDDVRQWLEGAVEQLHKGMYSVAKQLWGERSQAQQYINMCVSKKRSLRCHGQLKAARRAWQQAGTTARDIAALVGKIQWPKWIVHPERTPASSPHAEGARLVFEWRRTACPQNVDEATAWAEDGWQLWKRVRRVRTDWRTRTQLEARARRRDRWMQGGHIRKALRESLGAPFPPIKIRGALTQGVDGLEYHETRTAVADAMTDLLDSWVPHDERTEVPAHLLSQAAEDEDALPRFVKEWLLADIKSGGTRRAVFDDAEDGWQSFQYDSALQRAVDRLVSKGVAPGYGGVHQELWVAAPECVRARERQIFNVIIRTGVVPDVLNHRQMVFLPKSETASNVWERQGLPPWRPITMQSALATRLFTALSGFLEKRAPNNARQHGFQRDRTVQDASLATSLLIDRAVRRKEPLYLLSKDCEKCYDRIPRWVMVYIYKRLGVPAALLQILNALLSAGEIDVRTDYGWIPTGKREFGLGQGSVLSIRHIGYYMDVLIERQARGPGAVHIAHSQPGDAPPITSIVLVDDVVDVATSYAAITDRADVSNVFTGINGTGGVFGAAKSFLLCVNPPRRRDDRAVFLADGKGHPRAVVHVSPYDGFKHLGVFQNSKGKWGSTLRPVWERIKRDAARIIAATPKLHELQYIVNCVWIPRLAYRTQLSPVLKLAPEVDKLVRRVARRVLRLPLAMATAAFHDHEHGLGLTSFADACRASRVALVLRVLNTPHVPAYHLLVEALEDYQRLAGLTSHPLAQPIAPPSHLRGWAIESIRAAARLGVSVDIEWTNPVECTSTRPEDRSLWSELPPRGRRLLLHLNVTNRSKLRFVGDLACARGCRLLSCDELARQYDWSQRMRTGYLGIVQLIQQTLCIGTSTTLTLPVGRLYHRTRHLGMAPISVAPDGFFIVSQFEEVADRDGEVIDIAPRYHELGQRVGDGVAADTDGLGRVIQVRWWHERTHGSGIWTVRPEGAGDEFESVCVPITVTPVGPRANRMRRVIVWTDTRCAGTTGVNDRNLVDTAFHLSHTRFHQLRTNQAVVDVDRACVGCNRVRDSAPCPRCNTWHHPECRACQRDHGGSARERWITTTDAVDRPATTCSAGDGSVRRGGCDAASGTWALASRHATAVGRVATHWRDITSTRCELVALIQGLASSQDTGDQVCDNQSAIQLLNVARDIATGRRPSYIKYSSKHRTELRTLISLMKPGGTFRAIWVRSHEESLASTDRTLTARRQALAIADEMATSAHTLAPSVGDSCKLQWDWATLVDNDERPVAGNVTPYLDGAASRMRRRAWMKSQQAKGPEYETVATASRSTATVLRWHDDRRRFYWRAVAAVLHTNMRKHRLVPAWDPSCRLCPEPTPDTQAHRFGCDAPTCSSVARLAEDVGHAIHSLCFGVWLPDQLEYSPGHGHALAASLRLPSRAWWRGAEGAPPAQWCPMVQIRGTVWVHACQVAYLTTDLPDGQGVHDAYRILCQDAALALPASGGLLLPHRIQLAVRQCLPAASAHEFHPTQATDIWSFGTVAMQYGQHAHSRHRPPPREQTRWWIDDIYRPRGADWWADTLVQYHESADAGKAVWAACYEASAGWNAMEHARCTWVVSIPTECLPMRTRTAVVQASPPSRAKLVARNSRPIWIGFLRTDQSHDATHQTHHAWADTLQYEYDPDWRVGERLHAGRRGSGPLHGCVSWLPASAASYPPPRDSLSTRWFTEEFPEVYAAPSGWRAWPSVSAHTVRWSLALSTSKRQGAILHAGILRAIWNANHMHWSRTCTANHEAIVRDGDDPDLAEANRLISRGVQEHQHLRFGLDTRMAASEAQQIQQSTAWRGHAARPPPAPNILQRQLRS